MQSISYYSLSKPNKRNFNVLLCSCDSNNFRKGRSQTDLMNSTDVDNIMAKRVHMPKLIGPIEQGIRHYNTHKPRNSCVRVSILYDNTLSYSNQSKKVYHKEEPKHYANKTKIIKGVQYHAANSKENIPILKGVKGARAKMHSIYIASIKQQRKSINTMFQTRNASHDFGFSISDNRKGTALPFNSIYNRKEHFTTSNSFVFQNCATTKYISKICIRCPAPKMLA